MPGPPNIPKTQGRHTDTLRSQDRVAGLPKCLCNAGQGGRTGSRDTQISPMPLARVAGTPDIPAPQGMRMSPEEGNYHPKDCEGGSSGLILSPSWAPIDMQTVSPCPAGTYRHAKCCH